ncbi:hypothetical protein KY313_01495 [Candidatus Woesearchaeota archaeon]|nr:hypothetical protein [Candidatus Woesearchaeota archaeon]
MNKAMGSLLLFFLFFGCAVQPELVLEDQEQGEVEAVSTDIEEIDAIDEDFSLDEFDEIESNLDELDW